MAKSLNEVRLIGNVGAVPEIKNFDKNGVARKLAMISLATSRSFKDKEGNWQEKTDWHRVKVWGKTAEAVEKYVKKGDKLYFSAHLEYSTTGEGDAKKYFTDIIGDEMIMLPGKPAGETSTKSAPAPVAAGALGGEDGAADDEDGDDLPF